MNEGDPKDAAAPATGPTTAEMVDALRFSHSLEMQTKLRLTDLAASFYALVETLTVQGVFPLDLYEERRKKTLEREHKRLESDTVVTLGANVDKYQLIDLPQIDCEARLPLCKARCCTLTFPLSPQDLDEGVVRWDYGRPYQIRRRTDGYCTHNGPGTGTCGVYEKRPSVCRTYDCRKDARIWLDFEHRIVAPE